MISPMQIAKPERDDYSHVSGILKTFPTRWAFGFARKYDQIKKKQGRQAANLYLIDRQESIKPNQIGLAASDEDINALAKAKARRYFERLATVGDYEQAYKQIAEEVQQIGVKPPAPKKGTDYRGECERFKCAKWWRRALRVAIGRHVEHEAIKAGFVGFRAAYVSNESLSRRQQQNRRNRQTLEWIEAENDSGYKATLAELSDAGVSNPENRKNELMTRIRGIEEEAKRQGMTCEFLTITAPSRYHATSNGRSNPKYDGSTPKQAQAHLTKTWAQIRAKLHRENIQPIGFRVAEPHKDGCPHWHLMLFIKSKQAKRLRQVCRHYALRVDGTEQGAFKHRFTAVSINPNKGSAAGYIAKYIAKNINMTGVEDFDRDGKSAADGLERSVAWAALWGIRQFQQIGGERITVWRELRRIREGENLPEVVAVLWQAADAGEYGAFIREAAERKISLIREEEAERLLYGMKIEPDNAGVFEQVIKQTGELITGFFNKYGEQVKGGISGVMVDGVEVVTRLNKWFFSYKPRSGLLGLV